MVCGYLAWHVFVYLFGTAIVRPGIWPRSKLESPCFRFINSTVKPWSHSFVIGVLPQYVGFPWKRCRTEYILSGCKGITALRGLFWDCFPCVYLSVTYRVRTILLLSRISSGPDVTPSSWGRYIYTPLSNAGDNIVKLIPSSLPYLNRYLFVLASLTINQISFKTYPRTFLTFPGSRSSGLIAFKCSRAPFLWYLITKVWERVEKSSTSRRCQRLLQHFS